MSGMPKWYEWPLIVVMLVWDMIKSVGKGISKWMTNG